MFQSPVRQHLIYKAFTYRPYFTSLAKPAREVLFVLLIVCYNPDVIHQTAVD